MAPRKTLAVLLNGIAALEGTEAVLAKTLLVYRGVPCQLGNKSKERLIHHSRAGHSRRMTLRALMEAPLCPRCYSGTGLSDDLPGRSSLESWASNALIVYTGGGRAGLDGPGAGSSDVRHLLAYFDELLSFTKKLDAAIDGLDEGTFVQSRAWRLATEAERFDARVNRPAALPWAEEFSVKVARLRRALSRAGDQTAMLESVRQHLRPKFWPADIEFFYDETFGLLALDRLQLRSEQRALAQQVVNAYAVRGIGHGALLALPRYVGEFLAGIGYRPLYCCFVVVDDDPALIETVSSLWSLNSGGPLMNLPVAMEMARNILRTRVGEVGPNAAGGLRGRLAS